MIRVLICDDHAIVRQGLRQILADSEDIQVIGEAADGQAALMALRNERFDVVLMDIAMPGRDGLEVLKMAKAEFPRLPVIMLSTYPDSQYAVRALKLGASGYLNKSSDPADLLLAIRKAAKGGLYISPAVAENLAMQIASNADQAPHEALSNREYQVFRMIAGGLSVTEIAQTLSLSLNTVSTYRSRIMEKISAKNDVEMALYAVKHQVIGI